MAVDNIARGMAAKALENQGGGGSSLPIVNTAAIGQTIRVAAVDDAGKPTEWEAVEFQTYQQMQLVGEVVTTEIVNLICIQTEPFALSDVLIEFVPTESYKPSNMWFRLENNGVTVLDLLHFNTITITPRGLMCHATIANECAFSIASVVNDYMWNTTNYYAFEYIAKNNVFDTFVVQTHDSGIPSGTKVRVWAR